LPDIVVGALIAAAATVLGAAIAGVLSLVSTLVNRRFAAEDREVEHREWYRRTLFEKRLGAVQEGYAWLMRLNRATSQPEARTQGSPQNHIVADLSQQAREWYDTNCVFLEDTVPQSSHFMGATNAAGTDLFWKMCIEAEKDLRGRLRELLESEREFKDKRGQQQHDE
jgi:hypothetical protein